MRVLDIDLDFFLNDVPYDRAATAGRLDSNEYTPWTPDAVDSFLAKNCGMNSHAPLPGKFVAHHHEAFHVWRELIESGHLSVPFELVHVDSHADLGVGDAGYIYLMGDLLHREVSERTRPEIAIDKMNFGNFLAFAIGCRWIKKLTYVPNPHGRPDLFECYFKNGDSRSGIIQLKAVAPPFFEGFPNLKPIIDMEPTEPDVQFQSVSLDDFTDDGAFDFVTLCQSPAYTPRESDDLIPVIRKYMLELRPSPNC